MDDEMRRAKQVALVWGLALVCFAILIYFLAKEKYNWALGMLGPTAAALVCAISLVRWPRMNKRGYIIFPFLIVLFLLGYGLAYLAIIPYWIAYRVLGFGAKLWKLSILK